MSLFQKKPDLNSNVPLYSIGANKTILIIGLGNPGKKYDGTRHNIGFEVIDEFAKKNDFPGWVVKKDLKALINVANMGDSRVVLTKPTTFMNNSGEAAQAVQHFYRVYNQYTVAIYDELAVKFGSLRSRVGGSDGGHNGVKSLIQHLGDDFGRLRIGIGSDTSLKADAADFVLSKFNTAELTNLSIIINEAVVMATEFIFGGQIAHDTRQII